MSEEQQKKPANITREELYRQVWATPMSRLLNYTARDATPLSLRIESVVTARRCSIMKTLVFRWLALGISA